MEDFFRQPPYDQASKFGEDVLLDGYIFASDMNWGENDNIVNVDFAAGPGMTFIDL